jgi:rubrerythrin
MSKLPIDVLEQKPLEIDKQILRSGIIAELDAVNLYTQEAAQATDPRVKDVLLSIAREEMIHVGEFRAVLLSIDSEYKDAEAEGADEIS